MENNDKLNNQELKEDLYKILDRNIVWINHADQKAAIIFAAISFLFAGSVMLNDVEIFISGFSQYNFLESCICINCNFIWDFVFINTRSIVHGSHNKNKKQFKRQSIIFYGC